MSVSFIEILILFFLSIQILPVAVGISISGKPIKAMLLILILSFVQIITYWLGLELGKSFMYLMDGFKGVVFFIGFLLIGIRMLMETFNIRKGERTYSIDSVGHVSLASLAQAINTFLAGLLLYYLSVDERSTLLLLFCLTLIISIIGVILMPKKQTLAFASLLYALGGISMIIIAIYISFFVL